MMRKWSLRQLFLIILFFSLTSIFFLLDDIRAEEDASGRENPGIVYTRDAPALERRNTLEFKEETYKETSSPLKRRLAEDYDTFPPHPLPRVKPGEQKKRSSSDNQKVSYDPTTGTETFDPASKSLGPGAELYENHTTGGGIGWPLEGETLKNFSDLIQVGNPGEYPWHVNCKVYVTFPDYKAWCSGVLIDAFHVLTAGYCVHEGGPGGEWADSVEVSPAFENGSSPFGNASESSAVTLHSWVGWTENSLWDWNMGWITLDRPLIPLGWHGYGYYNDNSFFTSTSNTFHNPSYPGETPYDGMHMYYWYGNFDAADTYQLQINKYSYDGMGGSGAYYLDPSENRIVYSVLSHGTSDTTSYVRITEGKFSDIKNDIDSFTPATVDLIPGNVVTSPNIVDPGDKQDSMEYWIINYSSASWSGQITVNYYLSDNDNISSSDTLLDTRYVNVDLGPKEKARVTSTSPPEIPSNTPPGDYWIGVIVTNSDGDTSNNDTDGPDASPIIVRAPLSPYNEGWTTLLTPSKPGYTLNLRGTWGTSENDVYSCGYFWDVGDETPQLRIPIILSYNGHVTTPMSLPRSSGAYLTDIWGSAGNNIYSVGHRYSDATWSPYMIRYNGSSWSEVNNLPDIGSLYLTSIWGASDKDIYAVGGDKIIHYDGSAWSLMTSPYGLDSGTTLNAVWGSAESDDAGNPRTTVYAAGVISDSNATPADTGVILVNNGYSWDILARIDDVVFTSIWGSSSSNVFIAGYRYQPKDKDVPKIFHYDGLNLTEMTVPQVQEDEYGHTKGMLTDIWGSSGDNVYVTGAWVVYQYNGSTWTQHVNSSGLSLWGSSDEHVFKGGWAFSKLGEEVTTTTGVKVHVATGTNTFDFIEPFNPDDVPDQTNRPSDLPYGLFNYSIPVPEGSNVTITFELPRTLAAGYVWWKYTDTDGWHIYDGAEFTDVVDEFDNEFTIITIQIQDNGEGDSDPRLGWIRDPSGPGNEGGGTPSAGGGGGGGGCFIKGASYK